MPEDTKKDVPFGKRGYYASIDGHLMLVNAMESDRPGHPVWYAYAMTPGSAEVALIEKRIFSLIDSEHSLPKPTIDDTETAMAMADRESDDRVFCDNKTRLTIFVELVHDLCAKYNCEITGPDVYTPARFVALDETNNTPVLEMASYIGPGNTEEEVRKMSNYVIRRVK